MKTSLNSVILVFLILFTCSLSFAKPINKEQAKKVAINKLFEIDASKKSRIFNTYEIKNDQNITSFFVFTIAPKGFLIVSGDDDLPPVISYSTDNEIGEINIKTNPLLSMLLYDLKLRLAAISKLPKTMIDSRHQMWNILLTKASDPPVDFEQWPPVGTTTTGGWLETNWTQDAPYNALCPIDTGGFRSVVGCPATAMAQILNYHKTTKNTTFTDADDYFHNYHGGQYWIDNDYASWGFPSFSQLNGYLATLQQHYNNNTPLTNTDKAALSFACGVAAKQVYYSGGSGTFGVDQARDAYIKFNCSTSHLIMGTDTSAYTYMTANAKAALPAHLAIVNEAWTSGHNVVVDGYNTNNYYHINFGWGGINNNWYLVPQEFPYSLTVIEGVVVDIMLGGVNLPEIYTDKPDNIFIYPNPVKDKLFIKTNYDFPLNSSVEIYTITGQSIYKSYYKNDVGIDVSYLKKGIYFINFIYGNSYIYKKFVKD
jgi:hypothetical protein